MTSEDSPIFDHDPLGGDVFVPDFDGPPEGSELDPDPWEQKIEDWASSEGRQESPLKGSWNTLPFGTPGHCRKNLFVDVRSERTITAMLLATRQHLIDCPMTELVVFHVGGDIGYLRWMNELVQQLPILKSLSSFKTTFVTRLSRSWTPRPVQNPVIWRGAIVNSTTPNHQVIAVIYANGTHREWRVLLKHRIWLLEELGLLNRDFGYKKHTKQPTTPAHGSDISFGTHSGIGIKDWMCRIYLDDTAKNLPIGFNTSRVPHRLLLGVDLGAEVGGNNGWIANERIGFLIDPYRWIDATNLPDRR